MINKIISAISTKLYEEFGDDYEIYTESIEQGLQEPCFFVQSIAPTNRPTIIGRRQRSVLVMVQYFPTNQESNQEINDVIERLTCIEEIEVEDVIIRGVDAESQIVDKVLNHQITYNFFMINEEEKEDFEDITYETEVGE